MKIHEYQAKQLLGAAGVPVPDGRMAQTAAGVVAAADELGYPCVIKAQVHAGGRGKAGGVRLVRDHDEAEAAAQAIAGMKLVSRQTGPEGKTVHRVWVERAATLSREVYLAILIDRERECPVVVASAAGGMEIEETAAANPAAIFTQPLHPTVGLADCFVRNLAFKLELSKVQQRNFADLLKKLVAVFMAKDLSLLEINPLVITPTDEFLVLDAKVSFDDNALFRHPDLRELRDPEEEEPLEVEASKFDLNYIKLDGNIGCMVNGAGLAMATMDFIKLYGGEPANFLDVGGATSVVRVKEAFKILLSDPKVRAVFVNIFGGIVRTDLVASGIVYAVQGMDVRVPVVVRLVGTNEEEGSRILRESGLNFIAEGQLDQAVRKVVELAARGA